MNLLREARRILLSFILNLKRQWKECFGVGEVNLKSLSSSVFLLGS
jgi:hypothetical protein